MDDATKCVICGRDNDCALADPETPAETECWCVRETFPAELIARVPDADLGQACICRRCLRESEAKSQQS